MLKSLRLLLLFYFYLLLLILKLNSLYLSQRLPQHRKHLLYFLQHR